MRCILRCMFRKPFLWPSSSSMRTQRTCSRAEHYAAEVDTIVNLPINAVEDEYTDSSNRRGRICKNKEENETGLLHQQNLSSNIWLRFSTFIIQSNRDGKRWVQNCDHCCIHPFFYSRRQSRVHHWDKGSFCAILLAAFSYSAEERQITHDAQNLALFRWASRLLDDTVLLCHMSS